MLDATGRTIPLQGPRRLLLAVLQEAIGTFQRYATARDRRGRVIFRQVEEWFASDETEWVFAFVSVCDALGLDATYVRTGLQRWMDGYRAPLEVERALDLLSFRAHDGIGAMARPPGRPSIPSRRAAAAPERKLG